MLDKRLMFAAASCAALALSACNREPEVINAGPPDAQEDALRNAAPVALPPSIAASRVYRCKDNSLVNVDFMNDDKTAVMRAPKDAEPVVLTAPEAGQPFASGDYVVTGKGEEITLKAPGKGSQSCRA